MQLEYDVWLIIFSLCAAGFATFIAFGFIKQIYLSDAASRRWLLAAYSVVIGTGIWGVQLLNWLSFNTGSAIQFSLPTLALSWLFGCLVGFSISFASSKRHIPFPLLISNGLIAGLTSYVMFYFTAVALHSSAHVTFEPIILLTAFLMAIVVCMLAILSFNWMKEYTGENAILVKTILAVITAAAIFGLQIVFSATMNLHSSAQTVADYAITDKKLLAAVISLSIVCMFSLVFIVAIFYEKLGKSAFKFGILNRPKALNSHILDAKDALTGLPNRRSFAHQLEGASKRCTRTGESIAVAFIDLDHFKPINDQFGHHIGDALLTQVARRLQAAVRGCDLVARLGGDEFVALIEEIKSETDITPIVERIVQSIKEPFFINDHQIEISCSVGIAIHPRDGDIEKLMISADAAMYKAKEAGRNQFKFYDSAIESAAELLQMLRQDLQLAFEHKQFKLVFQPKFDCLTRLPSGAEALVRWVHPTKGELSPKDFIAEAESFGLMHQLNEWVLTEVCRTIQQAANEGIDLNISINLANQQFHNANLVHEVTEILRKYGVPASKLTFEIKETAAIKNQKQFALLLSQFKLAKIKIALDNFGLDAFTLSYLQDLNINELKLDRFFIAKMSSDKASTALLDGLIKLAHALDLNVVAEGVETDNQCNILANLGCNHMQGYLFSKPIVKNTLFNLFDPNRNKFDSSH